MRRRTLLAGAAGAFAALAGCLSDDGPAADDGPGGPSSADGSPIPTDGATPTATQTPTDVHTRSPGDGSTPTDERISTDERTPTGDRPAADVTVESAHLQYGVVTPTSPDSIGTLNHETPYVVASVRVDGSLSREDFALRADDASFAPTTVRLYRTAWGDEEYYEQSRGAGLVLFELSSSATGPVRLTWPGGEHALDGSAGARLEGGPPDFSASLDVPATHAGTEAPAVAVEATNDGETPARFLGAVNRVGPMIAYAPVARLTAFVPAGETARIAVPDDWGNAPDEERIGDGEPDVRYHLHYGEEHVSAEIRLVESS